MNLVKGILEFQLHSFVFIRRVDKVIRIYIKTVMIVKMIIIVGNIIIPFITRT